MTLAARWFAKAAALGLADSQFNLAVLCERGEGVPQSLPDAYKWYAIAALTGDGEAKARMGVLDTQLSESDRAAANKSAASFHASPLIRSVNAIPIRRGVADGQDPLQSLLEDVAGLVEAPLVEHLRRSVQDGVARALGSILPCQGRTSCDGYQP